MTVPKSSSKLTQSGIAYTVIGQGPALILVNGLGRSASHWVGFDQLLADRFTVITYDPRGIGESRAPLNWNLTVDLLAQDVRDITEAEDLTEVFVYGFSLGGMIALTLALREPDIYTKIVCVNSSVGGLPRLRISPKAIATMAKGGIADRISSYQHLFQKGFLKKLIKENNPILSRITKSDMHLDLSYLLLGHELGLSNRRSTVDRWRMIERQHGRPIVQTIKQLGAAIRFSNPLSLRSIRVPTLMICGGNDVFVPNLNSKILGNLIPGSMCRLVPDGGHELHVDKPLMLKTMLIDFYLNPPKT